MWNIRGKFELFTFIYMKDNHIRFADKYFETLNAAQSAIYAGCPAEVARQSGYQILLRDDVQEYLSNLRAEYAAKSGVTKEWVIDRFKTISERCVQAEAVLDKDGNPTGEYKFDSSGANKATEMLGKIIGVFEKDNEQSKPNPIPPVIQLQVVKPGTEPASSEKDLNV